MNSSYDYLIVGSGLFGSTFAHLAHKDGKKCLVLERREHLGGNVYCEEMEGIHVHKYGAHIFHTNNKEIWEFVNNLVPFNRYTNCPVANYQGKLYNLPFNMNTFYQMWGVTTPEEANTIIQRQRDEARVSMSTQEPRNLEEQALLLVGRDIYERLVKGYTEKQWGRPCTDLPSFIIRRLPVRMVFDNNYFNDAYQGIPIGGYNKLINRLLEGVECKTGIDYLNDKAAWDKLADIVVYTGPIDAYFNYCYGELEWRSVRFEHEILDTPNYQGNAVINYTERTVPYTRVIEHKHFETFGAAIYDNPYTVISREYSMQWNPGVEPFYTINDQKNNLLFSRYKELAEKESKTIFGGRLAEYKYYDMAPVIERSILLYESTKRCI